jgi:lipopolysaccharide transport system permease protein
MSVPGMLQALWRYRSFIRASVLREFQSRYRGSALGVAWNVIQPLGTVVIFTVVFAQVMRTRLPGVADIYGYGVYLCAGLFAWSLFAEVTQRSIGVFIDNGNLLKKASFPKSSLPVIIVLSSLLNFAIAYGLFFAFLALRGHFPGLVVIAAVPILVVLVAMAVGLGVLLGTLHVFLRDIGQAVNIVLQFWFWLTPIVYPLQALPDFARGWLAWNPVAPLMAALQDIFVSAQWPNWSSLVVPTAFAALALLLGAATFHAHAGEIVDEL